MMDSCPTHGVPLETSPYDDGGIEKDFCPQCEIAWETAWDTKLRTDHPSPGRPLGIHEGAVCSVAHARTEATPQMLAAASPPSPSFSAAALTGKVLMPVKKLVMVAPYMALFGLAATVVVAITKPWKRD